MCYIIFICIEKLSLTEKKNKSKPKKEQVPNAVINEKVKNQKKKAKKIDPAEERINQELNKVAAVQSRLSKKMSKQKKIRAVVEDKDKSIRTGIKMQKKFYKHIIIFF